MVKRKYQNILNLVSFYLFNKQFDYSSFEELDEEALRIVHEQKMDTIIFSSLEKLNLKGSTYNALKDISYKMLLITTNQDFEYQNLCELFKQNSIDYIPLKGSFLKYYYPKIEDRLMGDIDVLIREKQKNEAYKLLLANGYESKEKGISAHHDLFEHGRYGHFEIHFRLLDEDDSARNFLDENVWNYTHNHRMDNEFNLVYLLAHYANHFSHGGASFKSMIDIVLFLKNENFNKDTLYDLLIKTNYLTFYNNVIAIANKAFDLTLPSFANTLNDKQIDDLIDYIFKCGDFGFGKDNDYSYQRTIHDMSLMKNTSIFSKFIYIIKQICIPYKKFKVLSKTIKYVPILLPFGWIIRLIKYCFAHKNRVKEKLHNIKNVNKNDVLNYQLINQFLGIERERK
ncbi:MAG: nucleotidyltransferase family protein [Erysipelotrichaceae bacterium]|nr:nucleotidyltransferase family protein [Erysipelotrichaceae bacterium]